MNEYDNTPLPTGGSAEGKDRVFVKPPTDLASMRRDQVRAFAEALHAALMQEMDPDGSKRAAAQKSTNPVRRRGTDPTAN